MIPQWVLTKANIWNSSITLPNGQRIRYGRYKVPCCKVCNSNLGNQLEGKISKSIHDGTGFSGEALSLNGAKRLWFWLNCLTLKTAIRSSNLRFYQDRRLPDQIIGSDFDSNWQYFQSALLHCCLYGGEIERSVYGSLFLFDVTDAKMTHEAFDFKDNHLGQTVLVRIGNQAAIGCLNDSSGVASITTDYLDRVSSIGPLNELQLTEVFCHLTTAAIQMRKPKFSVLSGKDCVTLRCERYAEVVELEEYDQTIFGSLLLHQMADYLPSLNISGLSYTEGLRSLLQGRISFLFSDIGERFDLNRRERERREMIARKYVLANRLK